MELRIFVLMVMISIGVSNAIAKEGFYDDRERGWYWYEDPEEEPEEIIEEEVEEEEQSITIKIDPFDNKALLESGKSSKDIIEGQKKAFDKAYHDAVVNPTKHNVALYLDVTQKIMKQGHEFSDTFKKTIWVSPEYDYSLQGRPNQAQAILAYNQKTVIDKEVALTQIAQEKGIVYFFRSDCPFCKRYSPVLKKFADQFGFTVIPVSLDGVGSKEFPYPKTSDYLAEKLNVEVVPATFIVEPDSNTVSTVGYGFMDWSSLVDRVIFANDQIYQPNEIQVGDVR